MIKKKPVDSTSTGFFSTNFRTFQTRSERHIALFQYSVKNFFRIYFLGSGIDVRPTNVVWTKKEAADIEIADVF